MSVNPKSLPNITWVFKSNRVFERPGEKIGEGYEGRVKLLGEKRNCSLVLHNLRLNDTGVYTSYQAETDTKGGTDPISIVNLSVYGKIRGDPPTPTDDAVTKSPHPLILVLSLVSCLLVQLFCVLKVALE
ncbi:antigen like protein [Clarias magur]|uniref:Antigen like protein n=1 Tax=Clarias magur TaxID=1594786 RepID=A0A8J4UQV8_CLAMG|nr:antigen like protein [Clarias magur]